MNSIASHRPYSWAKYWSLKGHDVTVLTAKKSKTNNDIELNYADFKIIEVENKLDTFLSQFKLNSKGENNNRNETLLFKLKTSIKNYFHQTGIVTWDARMPNKHDFNILQLTAKVKNQQWDVVISTFAPYANHLVAYQLKKQNKAKVWVADYRDPWTESHLLTGQVPFKYFEEYLEKKINQTADIVTTVTLPWVNQIKQKYNLDNVFIVENGFDLDNLKNLPDQYYWQNRKVRIVYTGSIYLGKQDPAPLFKAINHIAQSSQGSLLDSLEVLFAGGIKANIDQLIDQFDVSKWVSHTGNVSFRDALWMQRDADVLIFLHSPTVKGIVHAKIYEYVFSGTEIWGIGTTTKSFPGQLIEKSNCGECYGVDVELIESRLLALLQSGKKPKRNRDMTILKKYTRENLAAKLLDLANDFLFDSDIQSIGKPLDKLQFPANVKKS